MGETEIITVARMWGKPKIVLLLSYREPYQFRNPKLTPLLGYEESPD